MIGINFQGVPSWELFFCQNRVNPCFWAKKNGFVKKPFLAFQGFVPFWSEIGVLPIRSQLGILCFLLKNGWYLFVIGITLF